MLLLPVTQDCFKITILECDVLPLHWQIFAVIEDE